jgi:hypothetical protein
MKTQKGNVVVIAAIIVIVAVTAGIIGWMFAKNSQAPTSQSGSIRPTAQLTPKDETSNWKTYRNEVYGYEIQYPSYWVKNSFPDGDSRSAIEYKGTSIFLNQGGHGVPFDWKMGKSTATFGEHQWEVATFVKDNNIVLKTVSVPTKTQNQEGKEATINIELSGVVDDSSVKDFDEIISTLQFTK